MTANNVRATQAGAGSAIATEVRAWGVRFLVLAVSASLLSWLSPAGMASASTGGSVTFGTPTNYATGSRAISSASGDFNGDGDLDLVVANHGSGSVSVLLGQAENAFGSPTNYATGTNPFWVTTGDFNGDDDPDIAVANHGANTVSVLLGGAGGTFAAPADYAVPGGPTTVEVGKFDADAYADLAVGTETGNVTVLLGAAGGTFGSSADHPAAGGIIRGLAVGDFNDDGDPDLVTANATTNNVSVLLGGTGATFSSPTSYPVGTEPFSIAVRDFDADGDPDLAVANLTSSNVSVLLGGTAGTFGAATHYATGNGAIAVAVADIDGDGKSDLVTANHRANSVSVLLGAAGGTFGGRKDWSAGSMPHDVVVGDLDDDGSLDLVTANFGSTNISVLPDATQVVTLELASPTNVQMLSGSSWIAAPHYSNGAYTPVPGASYVGLASATGGATYQFRVPFSLPEDFSNVKLTGGVLSADNDGSVSVNGGEVLASGAGFEAGMTKTFSTSDAAQFQAGTNYLNFSVLNHGTVSNPMALAFKATVSYTGTAPPGATISTVAGNGTNGFSGDGGPATAASFGLSYGVAVDGAGNLYIADYFNHRVRRVAASDGKISTVAGNGVAGFSGDGGPATAASLRYPTGVALDAAGNLYIADRNNQRVRMVAASDGKISTVAGTGVYGFAGDGGPATAASLRHPTGVAVDGAGNLYIADRSNQRVRMVAASDGKISTVAGNGMAGFSGDGGSATAARLYGPFGVAVDGAGNLYIADTNNHRVRRVGLAPPDTTEPTIAASLSAPANEHGWHGSAVTVSFTCDDDVEAVSCSEPVTVTESGTHEVTGTATDAAGNTATATETVKLDLAPPVLAGAPDRDPDADGWYRDTVTVNWTASDTGGSELVSTPAAAPVTGEGSDLSATASVSDHAGHTTTETVSGIKIDRTAPVTSASAPDGWQNEAVTVQLAAADNLSGVAATYYQVGDGDVVEGTSLELTGDGTHQIDFWSVDVAGNEEARKRVEVKVDRTAPTITFEHDPLPNGNGWNDGDVKVTFTCTDATSGPASCTEAQTVGTEGTAQPVTGVAKDNAGNTNSATTHVSIDVTDPVIAATPSHGPNGDGWYASPPTVAFTCTDSPSGVKDCPSAHVFGEGRDQNVTGTARDAAGNTASSGVTGVNVDTTAPTITGAVVEEANGAGWHNGAVTVAWTCDDNLSGVVGCPAATVIDTEGEGLSATATVTDLAGNSAVGVVEGINIDRTAPSLAGAPARDANAAGWYSAPVDIQWTCDDDGSGIAACPDASTIEGDGDALTATATVKDKAGNATTAVSAPVSIDTAAPTTTASAPSAWQKQSVTVTLDGRDGLSGVEATYYRLNGAERVAGSQVVIADEGEHRLEFWSVDFAGNKEAHQEVVVRVDKTAPTITHAFDPKANEAGWHKASVEVTFECADGRSGVASCTSPQTLHDEGRAQQADGRAEDNAGNVATDTATVNIDKTAPTITAARAPKANDAGWANTPVTVSFECDDRLSGVLSCSTPVSVGEGAGQSAEGAAEDVAGNSAAAAVDGINVDVTAPQLSGTVRTDPVWQDWHAGDVTVGWTCDDNLSQVPSCPGDSTVTAEGSNLAVSASASDAAGNGTTASVDGINIDRTGPALAGAPTTEANAGGWYSGDVTIAWTATDALSGVATEPDDGVITGEGVGLATTAAATDNVGNTTSATSGPVNIDRTSPQTRPSPLSAWHNDTVTVTLTAGDNLSGVESTRYRIDGGDKLTGTSVEFTEEGIYTLAFSSVDVAGNKEPWQQVDVRIDRTAPTITHSTSPAPNAGGWNNTGVTVTFLCGDGLSGVARCDGDTTLTEDGKGHQVVGEAADEAGNTATDTAIVDIDTTAPSVTATLGGQPNDAGWHAAPVAVTYSCADALSGVELCPAVQTLLEGADQQASGTGADRAGNSATGGVEGVNIDLTAPTIAGAATTAANGAGWYRGDVDIAWTCADALSGIETCPQASTITTEGGALTAAASAADVAGNTASATVTGIKIDRTAPNVLYSGNAGSYDVADTVAITCSATDALSGIDTSTCADITGPAYLFAVGTNTFDAGAKDLAGNSGRGETSFTVTVSADGMEALIGRFVTDAGVASSLISKVDAAEAAEARGNTRAETNILGAFANQLSAQTGKSVTAEHAELLVSLSQHL